MELLQHGRLRVPHRQPPFLFFLPIFNDSASNVPDSTINAHDSALIAHDSNYRVPDSTLFTHYSYVFALESSFIAQLRGE
ncbi:MAG: hypothetical protein JW915_20065 [Chitinispirillaceae bacterium]|nr:hypothetical protein [Chitinispirillaceae bacterium]